MTDTTTTKPTCIVAYLGEDAHSKPVADVATAQAKASGAELILYDADAASRLAPPLPTWWSGDGDGEAFKNRLSPEKLDAVGREDLATLVREARGHGVKAHGWLPTARGAKDLAAYASEVGADLLILPADLEDIGFFARMKGENTPGEVEAAAHIPVMTVDLAHAGAG